MAQDSKPIVGIRLRALRERQGWSLRALAERCGLSINAISRIERGENSPTVSSLHRLSAALAVPITDFFVDRSKQPAIFIKKGLAHRSTGDGFVAEHLGGLPGKQLEPFLLRIEPKCASAARPINHPGEEFVHCLSGEIEFNVNEEIFNLTSGDSLLFEANQFHSWRNNTSEPAEVLLVFQAAQDNSLARMRHNTG